MQVELLPAAPLPGGVKVARRPVKPLVLVRVQVWQPFSGCNVSSRRPCSERGGRKCNSCHLDHFWKAGRYKLAAPVLKTGSARTEVGALPTPSAKQSTHGGLMPDNTFAFAHAVFHVVLFFAIHGSRVRRRATRRKATARN